VRREVLLWRSPARASTPTAMSECGPRLAHSSSLPAGTEPRTTPVSRIPPTPPADRGWRGAGISTLPRVRSQILEKRTLFPCREPRHSPLRELPAHPLHLELPHRDRHRPGRIDAVAPRAALAQHARAGGIGIGQRGIPAAGRECEQEEPAPQSASRQYATWPGASATPTSIATMCRPPASAASVVRRRAAR